MRIAWLFGIATSVIDGGSSFRRVWSGDHHRTGATLAATPRQRDSPLPRNEWVAGQVSSRQPAINFDDRGAAAKLPFRNDSFWPSAGITEGQVQSIPFS
jgi:hypothetical protein